MEITERKRSACLENSKKGVEAVRARIALLPPWVCAHCGVEKPKTVHRMRNKYCSQKCMSEVFKKRMLGSGNPNYKGIQDTFYECAYCGGEVRRKTIAGVQRYCSHSCKAKAMVIFRKKYGFGKNARCADANQPVIVEALLKAGASIMDTVDAG